MSSVDLIFVGQSNVFQTDTRTAPANIIQQPDVPAWLAMHLTISDMLLKVRPWSSLDARYMTYPFNGSRQWVAAPEFAVRHLIDTYGHEPRLFKHAMGASEFYTHWKNESGGAKLTQICQAQLAAAFVSTKYAGTPDARIIVTIHGETDAQSATPAANYQASMEYVLSRVRSTAGSANTHVIVVQLHNGGGMTYKTEVRDAQVAWVAAQGSNATLIDPSAISGHDGTHYTQDGAQALGILISNAVDEVLGRLP